MTFRGSSDLPSTVHHLFFLFCAPLLGNERCKAFGKGDTQGALACVDPQCSAPDGVGQCATLQLLLLGNEESQRVLDFRFAIRPVVGLRWPR